MAITRHSYATTLSLAGNTQAVRCPLTSILTSILTTVSFTLLRDTRWFTICSSSSSSPARQTCKAANSKHFHQVRARQLSNTTAVSTEVAQMLMSNSFCRTHRGTQMGLSVTSRDSTPPGEILRGNVLVRCRASRISLIAASTESLLV
jgi:hypothetical protein